MTSLARPGWGAAAITEKCEEERDTCDTGQGGGDDGGGEGR